jgi:23S rRNA (uracil747-C5)-methyltransferase
MGEPYPAQLAAKQRRCALALGDGVAWLEPFPSREEGFRNKAKMVAGGTVAWPTLGILDAAGQGVDLRDCGILQPGIRAALPTLAAFVSLARLEPYDVPGRRGELKYLLVTESPAGELMVRFVLRSEASLPRLRQHLPALLATMPRLRVVSANLHPEHKAVLEGEEEVPLTEAESLPLEVGDVVLHLRPRSFFQTNTAVAVGLYRQARAWVDEVEAASVWDLYCGVGGFALHCAAPGRDVTGVESSPEAVASARLSASEAGVGARFEVGDATTWARGAGTVPEVVVVNPPRRGIGPELAAWLEGSGVGTVVYSSCNVDSLARDLVAMPSLRPVRARLFDMFPQTAHHEVMVLLRRA